MKNIKWMKRTAFGILLILCVLLTAGFIFESVSRYNAEKIKPKGQFTKVNNHRLHYLKEGNGGPTVVFETAFDPAGHLQWYNIQQDLPKTFTSVSYDRAGILWSNNEENNKSGEKIAEELHILLNNIKVPKPYILVGHSFGGTLIRFFVKKYPEDVAGVILVDSQYPNDKKYLSPELYSMVNQGLPSTFLRFANRFGAARLMFRGMFPKSEEYKYQSSVMPALLHKSAYAVLEEQDEMNSIKLEASIINSFGNIPLSVISAADEHRFDSFINDENLKNEMLGAWSNMQKDLLTLSTDSKQIVVPNSGHYINQDQPKVIEHTITEMIGNVNKINLK